MNARDTKHEARCTRHEARILVMAMMAICSASLLAMPTEQELEKVQPMVAELMAPTMYDFKAKKKTAAEVADMAVKYAGEAETEAAKFMLYRSSIPYYVRGEAYDKAADAVKQMKTNVKGVPGKVIAEIISKATVRANREKAPRLFELYQQARTQATAEKDVEELQKKPASPANRRKLAEAFAMAGKWPEALKEFANLKDKTAQIAKKEQDGSAKSIELGEFWWAYKPNCENADDAFKIHAAVHYRKALAAGEITGLKKNIVEQRIAKYAAIEGSSAGQGASLRTSAATGLYCVIDLSGGPDAKKYPVSYLNDMPKGGWSDEYKTTKLVLRRIEPGAFMMGEKGKGRHVVIKEPFYMGVFEVTQKQWSLIIGDRPSFWKGPQWSVRPVEQVTYDRIRGENLGRKWPKSDEVDEHSFMWLLRQKTGLRFDLPTEAQWEYACRAGTTTIFHNNCEMVDWRKDPSLDKIARYQGSGGWNEEKWGKFDWGKAWSAPDRDCGTDNGTAAVGSYQPNNWGLYDTLGNVAELCLDYENATNTEWRVVRGGYWTELAYVSTAHWRGRSNGPGAWFGNGFRLCLPLAGGAAKSAPVVTRPPAASIELKTGGNSPFTVKGDEATLELKNGAKLEFVKCPSGWVKVVDDYENKTVRKVEITRPFWIMKQGLRNDDVIGRTLEKYGTGHGFIEPNQEERDKFCLDLTDELKGVLPKGYVVRPPSLVEWEYAYHAGDEDPSSEPFGSLLKFHDYNTFNTHKGTSPVNKWGLHDFHVVEQIFDRVDDSGRAAVKVNKKDKKNISKLPDAQSDKDVFFWSNDRESASYLVRRPTGCALELKPKNSRTGFVRLVIGPDLVREWKAKNGKK